MADNKQDTKSTAKALSFGEAIGQLVQDARGLFKYGFWAGLVGLCTFDAPTRQLMLAAWANAGHRLEAAGLEVGPMIREGRDWTVDQFERFRNAALIVIGGIFTAGALTILACGFLASVLLKALLAITTVLFTFVLVNHFWISWMPIFLGAGVLAGVIGRGSELELAKQSLANFPKFLFGGLQHGFKTGALWIGEFWQLVAKTPFWFTVGAMYLVLVPVYQVKPLLAAGVLVIPIFFLGILAYPHKERGHHISWILWAAVFYLVDVAFLAVFPVELYQPIVRGELLARVLMMSMLVAESLLILHIVHRSNRGTTIIGVNTSGLAPRILGVVNWTWVWVFLIAALTVTAFAYLAKSEQWGTVVSGNAGVKANHAINSALAAPVFPAPTPRGDGHYAVAKDPFEIKRLAGGGVELTFPADVGWFRTKLDHRWSRGGIRVEVVDSTYYWLTDSGERVERSVGGWPYYQLPKNSPQVTLREHYLDARLMQGGLLIKHGRAMPQFVGAGIHTVRLPDKLWQGHLGDPQAELYLAINVPQLDDMRLHLAGTITVRLRPVT